MPDMERITDSLKLHLARDPVQREWEHGYQAGKRAARFEVVVVAAVAVLTFALLRWLASA